MQSGLYTSDAQLIAQKKRNATMCDVSMCQILRSMGNVSAELTKILLAALPYFHVEIAAWLCDVVQS